MGAVAHKVSQSAGYNHCDFSQKQKILKRKEEYSLF